jgi:hypothetical protein
MPRTDPTPVKGMPTFARPLTGQADRSAGTSTSLLSPVVTVVSLVTLSCAALFLVARPDGAQNLPNGKSGATGHKKASAVTKTTVSSTGTTKELTTGDAQDQHGLEFYTSNVRDGMFSAPQPPRAKPIPPPVVVVRKKEPVIIVPPMVINPFAEWSYTGTVHMGDITMALLENTRTKEGQYVKSGDGFMGAQVQSITDQMVTLTNAGKPTMLAKADTIVITPLNQNAPTGAPQGQPGQPPPGQPGQPPMTMTMPTGPMDAAQIQAFRAARRQQRLDSQFSGKGGGGGRRGGGYGGGGGGG